MKVSIVRDEVSKLFGGIGYSYSFEHVEELKLTPEEIDAIGKESGKIDGIYKGYINWELVKTAQVKLKAQQALEDEYQRNNPIEDGILIEK